MIQVGQSATATVTVTESNIAKTMKSGSLEVFGEGPVGIALSISHDAPSPIGATITATATVTAVEGRKISFAIEASDGVGIIGKGTHERFVINNEKFMSKVSARKASN